MSKLIRHRISWMSVILLLLTSKWGMSPEWYFPANFRTMAHTFLIDVRLLILETKLCHDLLFAHSLVGCFLRFAGGFLLSNLAILIHMVFTYDVNPSNATNAVQKTVEQTIRPPYWCWHVSRGNRSILQCKSTVFDTFTIRFRVSFASVIGWFNFAISRDCFYYDSKVLTIGGRVRGGARTIVIQLKCRPRQLEV